MFKNFFRGRKTYKTSNFKDYQDYLKVQYRLDPKEFMDSRLKIVSSFVYICPILESLGISKKMFENEGQAKGQLKSNNIKILDAGCRDGWTIEFLNSIGYTDVLGIELFDEYVNYCNNHNRRAVKGDLHKLEFEDYSFDFVYCRHTLEHCLDPVTVINEMMRVLSPNGVLYCSFPLESEVVGKHTTAIPDLETARDILNQLKYKFSEIHIGMSREIPQLIPEGDEMMLFLQKNG